MAEDTASSPQEAPKPVRRRASRAAGPAGGVAPATTAVVDAASPKVRLSKPAPPPRRQAHRTLVTLVALATAFVAAVVTGAVAWWAFSGNRHMEADAARNQAFVDTASQTVVNMFSYNQNSIDE